MTCFKKVSLFCPFHSLFTRFISSEGFLSFIYLVNRFSKLWGLVKQTTLSKAAARPFYSMQLSKNLITEHDLTVRPVLPANSWLHTPAAHTRLPHRALSHCSPVWKFCYLVLKLPSSSPPTSSWSLGVWLSLWNMILRQEFKETGPASMYGLIPLCRVFSAERCKLVSS